MGFFDRKKIRADYAAELQKQTDPYAYYIAKEQEETGGVRQESSPLVSCMGDSEESFIREAYSVIEFGNGELELAVQEGETPYLVFVNTNGELARDALNRLFFAAQVPDGSLDAELIYCDEDFITREGHVRHTPWMKPDWSPDTLLSFNYIGSLFAVKRSLAKQIEVLTLKEEPDEEVRLYDFLLKYTERANKITHVSEILFHQWGAQSGQIYRELVAKYESAGYTAVRKAAFARRGVGVPEWEADAEVPLVSVIIPSKDHADILIRCLDSIQNRCKGVPEPDMPLPLSLLEIIIVDNGSRDEERNRINLYIKENPRLHIFYLYNAFAFNFSKMCNQGAKQAHGSYLLFLNDDIEVRDKDFIEKLLAYASAPHVGAVGAKLYYPDSDILQHAGVTDLNCGPSHKLATHSDSEIYYFGRNRFNYDVLAVTGACLMLSKEKYFKVGGFSDRMEVSYNDVDLCVKLYEQGYYNVVRNDCVLYHHESLSRGADRLDDGKYKRLSAERTLFYERHAWLIEESDPFYNKNLIPDTLDFGPDVQVEHEKRDYKNPVIIKAKLSGKPDQRLHFHMEGFSLERAVGKGREDAYRFEGWAVLLKHDNAMYERRLCLREKTVYERKQCLELPVSPKYRTDVEQVFKDAKNAGLAGFVCRIPASVIGEGRTYSLGMLFISKLWGRKYVTIGEYYVSRDGLFREEI
ncbi:MAG: glycosyltransferase [Lachnospiraceae bacterium]